MHRFGRSAQQKLKDRWGGSFILATILALVGAWFAGTWLNDTLKGDTAGTEPKQTPGVVDNTGTPGSITPGGIAQDFNLYFVQVGAFRSRAGAEDWAQTLNDRGFTTMVAPKGSDGLHRVYGGLFTDTMAANEAKSRLLAEGTVSDAYIVSVPVPLNADVVPATATGTKSDDLRKGLEAMNTYLYDVAVWIQGLSNGAMADTTTISAKGKQLAAWATNMEKAAVNDPSVGKLADLAAAASANAVDIQNAAKAMPGSNEYRMAMTNYLMVLDGYRSLRMTGN